MDDAGSYTCPECGEEVVVPVDASAGEDQEYVEDCPVCCSPVLLRVHVEPDGEVSISASPE
jgi:DNA-directed RNA polymerase subunit RPC12/RpoP